MALNLTENAKKYIKIGVITVGVGLLGFAGYKLMNKPSSGSKSSGSNSLKGIGGRKKRKKSKKQKVLSLN